jgi:DNA-binding MarR family transcriptional regulator
MVRWRYNATPVKKKAEPAGQDEYQAMARLCLSASLRRTERLVTRHYDSYLQHAGVTAVQLPMLGLIADLPDASLRLLTEHLELDRSTLSRNLAVLQKLGLVVLGPSSGPKPGRITLTKKGHDALHRGHREWQKAHRALLEALDGESVDGGLQFLKRLRATVRGRFGVRRPEPPL